ncbi:DUF5696 domain-containing protein [Cohnella sp.]|uniref:DUF5696 domain-containing protein n=1 Tax=Cohnella sp. TaxID=1883426 RepID=UPI00356822D0
MKIMRWSIKLLAVLALVIGAYVALKAADGRQPAAVSGEQTAVVLPEAGEPKNGPAVRVARTERLAMDFDPGTAVVTVTDLASGALWSSNPADRETDKVAKGAKLQDLNAQLLLDYVDEQSRPFQLNNYTGSIKDGTYAWKRTDDGVEVTFAFGQAGFVIPVRYSLQDDGFSAAVETSRIEQRGKYSLVNINLLPFFGAGGIADEGYLLVPDGSGALMRFNNGKSIYQAFDERVYGRDRAVEKPLNNQRTETVMLPVFGLKKNDAAFVAVIRQGAYQAGIRASVSGKSNAYNSVSGYLNLMEIETNVVMEGSANEKQVLRASASNAGGAPFEVRYHFLGGDRADYTGMAGRYRQYLQEEQGVKPYRGRPFSPPPLMLELIGAIPVRETFLGIPYGTTRTLTSFDDIRDIAARLRSSGVPNVSIRLAGWQDGGMRGKVPISQEAESGIGGNKGFRKLAQEMEEQGNALYPVVDPINLYVNGNGFNRFFDAARNISRAPALQRSYLLGSGARDPNVRPSYLMKPESVAEAIGKFAKSAEKNGYSRTAYESVGSMLYSDFRKNSLSKNETGRIWEESLRDAASRSDGLLFGRANAYTFPNAEALADVPLNASGFDMEDESVPFYSMAVSGLIPAYGEPINLRGDTRAYLLKLLETGTYPAYRFVARDGSLLVGTAYDDLYGGDFNLWFEDVISQYEELSGVLSQTAGQSIVRHDKLGEGVYRTEFAGGKTVTVNYSNDIFIADDEPIEPNGYRVR